MYSRSSRVVCSSTLTVPVLGAFLFSCLIAATTAFAADRDGVITTLAGTGTPGPGGDGNAATLAQLNSPRGAAVDAAGNVYIADTINHKIRKVTVPLGVISTFAGTGAPGPLGDGGPATAAQLSSPVGVAVDPAGNVYIADQGNSKIRRVDAGTGIITTIAGDGNAGFLGDDGPATNARLYSPSGVALNSAGDLYIADTSNNRIRRVAAGTGIITTIAGNGAAGYTGEGQAIAVSLSTPTGVAVDGAGNVYIADRYNGRVRKVTAIGIISTVAGTGVGGDYGEGGPAVAANLNHPAGVAVDADGNVFIVDLYNQRIRKITVATGLIATVAGSGFTGFEGDGGLATAAALHFSIDDATGLAVDGAGAMYIADTSNHRVRKVAAPAVRPLLMTTVAGDGTEGFNGDGPANGARLFTPTGVAVDGTGNLYIADFNNARVRKVRAGVISTVAGTGAGGYTGDGGPATSSQLSGPRGVAVDGAGNVYIADQYNNRIRKITLATGAIDTVAGNGSNGFSGDGLPATTAQLNFPTGVAVDSAGNLYIADQSNHRVRKVTAANGVITTIAGTGTPGYNADGVAATAAHLNSPESVAVDGAGNVYVADTNNHRVRKVAAANGLITTFAGTGTGGYGGEAVAATAARLNKPSGVALDVGGNLYIADSANSRIRKVAANTGLITTVAGSHNYGFGGDGGLATAAQLNFSNGVAVDAGGSVYIADTSGQRVRRAGIQVVAPTSLTAVRSGASAFLSWTESPGAVSYNLYRSTTSTGPWSLLSGGIGGTSFLDSTIAADTTYYYYVAAVIASIESAPSNVVSFRLSNLNRSSDFDGDGKSDVTVYRPSTGTWYVLPSSPNTPAVSYQWGTSTDIPVPGDYDGDSKTDIAVFRPSTGTWYLLPSIPNRPAVSYVWGGSGDVVVPNDYDGDGRTDIAVYRPSTGFWYVLFSSTNFTTAASYQWGVSTDIPVSGDYDGDRKADIAIYRPATGMWYVLPSRPNTPVFSYQWGVSTDKPVVGDYDGDGKSDIAIYRPSTGTWYVLPSSPNRPVFSAVWGVSTDTPVPADYDADGRTDIAVYRPSTGIWYVLLSGSSAAVSYQWGISTDIPMSKRP